jgi:hypothetical protein
MSLWFTAIWTVLSWLACILHAYCPVCAIVCGWLGVLSFLYACAIGVVGSRPQEASVEFLPGALPSVVLQIPLVTQMSTIPV